MVKSGGKTFSMERTLYDQLMEVKEVVTTKDWDYVCVIGGNPGVGKSTFSHPLAKAMCPWFDETYICFTAEEFIKVTNKCPKFSSVILDESFDSMNTNLTRSKDFLRIMNHLQIIRQKNLFIFLCLPNFFDLAKGIAIWRSHHLFVCYSKNFGDRGTFAVFNRDRKKKLYLDGKRYYDYNIIQPNIRGNFFPSKVLDWDKYEEKKAQHLQDQDVIQAKSGNEIRDKLIGHMNVKLRQSTKILSEFTGIGIRTVQQIIKDYKDHTQHQQTSYKDNASPYKL